MILDKSGRCVDVCGLKRVIWVTPTAAVLEVDWKKSIKRST